MKTHITISLIIMAIALICAIGGSIAYGGEGFLISFGIVCCIGGVLSLFAAAFLGMIGSKLARAFLLAAGLTFLIGTGTCSTLLL